LYLFEENIPLTNTLAYSCRGLSGKEKKFCNVDVRIFLFLVIFSFLGAPTDGQTINIPNAIQFLEKFRNKLLELAGDAAAGLTSG
jgi:hypothetical protein